MIINCIKKHKDSKAVKWDKTNLEEVLELAGTTGVVDGESLFLNLKDNTKGNIVRPGHYVIREGFGDPLVLGPDKFADQYTFGRSYSWALDMLKTGHRVCRKGWNGKGMWLMWIVSSIARPHDELRKFCNDNDLESMPTLPWIGMKTADNCFVPWLCSQTDALAEDWELAQ